MALGHNYQPHVKFYSEPRRRGAAGGKAVIAADDVVEELRTRLAGDLRLDRVYCYAHNLFDRTDRLDDTYYHTFLVFRTITAMWISAEKGSGSMYVQVHRTRAAVKLYRAGRMRHRYIHTLFSEVCDHRHLLDGLYRWIAVDTSIQYHFRNSNCQLFCANILRVVILPRLRDELEQRGVC